MDTPIRIVKWLVFAYLASKIISVFGSIMIISVA